MLAQIAVFPIGKGASLSKHVAACVDEIEKSGLDYQLTSMGTIVEGEWDEVMKLLKKVRDRAMKSADRLYVTVAIDDRKGKGRRIEGKVRSVESLLGKPLKK